MKLEIDVSEFAAQLKAGKGIGGKDGALTPLIKQLTEMALQAEIETHLAQDLERNRKNGTMECPKLEYRVTNRHFLCYTIFKKSEDKKWEEDLD